MTQVFALTLEGTTETRDLTTAGLTVGRGQDNDWVLIDTAEPPAMSRRHCRFDLGARGPLVTDLGSTNGTRVNDQPVAPHSPFPLRGGEVIEIGLRRLVVRTHEQAETPPERPDPAAPLRSLNAGPSLQPDNIARSGAMPMFRDPIRRDTPEPLGFDTPEDAVPAEQNPGAMQAKAAFLIGAGASFQGASLAADTRSPEQFLNDAGQVFATLARGLRELLTMRKITRHHADPDGAFVSATSNPSGWAGRGAALDPFTAPLTTSLAAIEASFRDLKSDEQALRALVQSAALSAVNDLLQRLDPRLLESQLPRRPFGRRGSRLWKLYQAQYKEIAATAHSQILAQHAHAAQPVPDPKPSDPKQAEVAAPP